MKVAVVSGSRADFGLLRPTLDALRSDPSFEPCLLVTAMHLDATYGETLGEIQASGHAIAAYVPAGAPVRQPGDLARNLGRATIAFAEALQRCRPDVLLVLGDRFESLAAALAAASGGVPVAHLHGGELSEGSLDDALRHCITKLSHLHLVATRTYGERVCQLGEDPARVHVVGATGPESIRQTALLDRRALAESLGLAALPSPLLALTLHPESLDPSSAGVQADALTGAVDDVLHGEGCVVVTLPNDDPGNHEVRPRLVAWADTRANVHAFASLGQRRYLSLLSHADVVLGNSSSAIIEAPSFALPAVNVGERQRGRVMAANVVSCQPRRAAVARALRGALDPAFRASLATLGNPYDLGDPSGRVLAALSRAPIGELKYFCDLPDGPWRTRLRLSPATRIVVAGAGGHARSVIDALRTSGRNFQPMCTDPDSALHGDTIDGAPVVGDDAALPDLLAGGVAAACPGIGGVGDNRPRARLHAHLQTLGFELPAVVHGGAQVSRTASLGNATVALAGSVVGSGASVGEDVIVGSAVTVEHDCTIGDHVHLASACVLGGAVQVATGAHVGLGATILQGRSVGPWAVVGAGAVVVHDVPGGETVVGCPAAARGTGAR
jgi:UDP-hydrolysing UDP-N-acetyl-D-glucosamine 2-epimerase